MARVMAFDYGSKRIGIAVTDVLKIVASPLDVIHPDKIYNFIEHYMKEEAIEQFVVGHPLRLSGENTHATIGAENFARSLKNKYKIPVDLIDERYSSSLAKQAIFDSGAKKSARRNKENLDKVSAAIILQWWMQQNII